MALETHRRTFISYSRVNKEFAVKLAKELRSDGIAIWLDQLDIPTGSRWDDELEKALEECGIFMVILTPASIGSENVKDEIGYAIDNRKRILPVLLEACNVPLRLRRFQYVDFTTKSYDEGVQSAKELLGVLANESTTPKIDAVAPKEIEANVETEQKMKEESARLAKQKADAERKAKEESEKKEKSTGTVVVQPVEKITFLNRLNAWLQVWWKRGLIFTVVETILGTILLTPYSANLTTAFILASILLGIPTLIFGMIFYHHKVSYILTAVLGVIAYILGLPNLFGSSGSITLDLLVCIVFVGFPIAAITSQVLHALKKI